MSFRVDQGHKTGQCGILNFTIYLKYVIGT